MKNTTYQRLWDAIKAILTGKAIAWKCLYLKRKNLKTKKLDIHLKKIQKKNNKINTKKVEGKKHDKVHPRLEVGRADVVEGIGRELRKLESMGSKGEVDVVKEGIAGRLENMDGSRDPGLQRHDCQSYLTGVRELVGGEYIGVFGQWNFMLCFICETVVNEENMSHVAM